MERPAFRQYLPVAALLFVFISIGSIGVYDQSETYDESAHLDFGRRVLRANVEHASMQKMPITALNALPAEAFKAISVGLSPKAAIWVSRLPTLLFATILGYFVFAWSSRLYGRKGGLLSLTLFCFCPTMLAHGSLATTDAFCSVFSFLAVYAFMRHLHCPSWTRLCVSAALMGLAQLSKHTALLLLPVVGFAACIYEARRRIEARTQLKGEQRRTVAAILRVFAYAAIVLFTINAGYAFRGTLRTIASSERWLADTYPGSIEYSSPRPFSLKLVPLPLPGAYVEAYLAGQYFNKTGQGHGPIYLWGRTSRLGWWYYFPLALTLKIPIPTLVLLIWALLDLGAAMRARSIARSGAALLASDAFIILLCSASIFSFFCLFCTSQIGVRYLLPCLPFFYVIVGRLAGARFVIPLRARAPAIITSVTWLAASVISFYPGYISYFNEFCPRRLSLYRYLADSNLDWGQDENRLRDYLNAHPNSRISVNPPAPTTGTVAVHVNDLVGVISDVSKYAWLRDRYTPVSRIGYSILVYEVSTHHPD